MSYLQLALKAIKKDETLEPKIRLVEKQKLNKSPEEIMDSILLEAKNRIVRVYNGKQCHQTDEIRTIEDEMGRIYRAVLDGQGGLSDFQNICQQWSQAHIENLTN